MIKVRAHTCYLGKTGYSSHAREFFRELSNHVDLRVRNYTWDNNPDYINDKDLSIIDRITLTDNSEIGYSDYPISKALPNFEWKKSGLPFEQDVDIVLMDMNHHYFYGEYTSKVKIAYTVWESTELPQGFFEQLLKFDYLWVVTEWHKEVAIKQGYPAYRVFVVNEGVNEEFFTKSITSIPEEENDSRFKFMFFGRWDYRKSLPEIIASFLKAFPNNEPVDLILSADNPYSVDGMNSTEERLNYYNSVSDLNFRDPRIKIKHFVSREDYVSYIKNGNVLVTCARSEGWNIPLIEAMSAGTPVIYSDWGAQLEFAGGKGNPVRVKKELPASIGAKLGFAGDTPGLYAEPDYDHLVEVLKDCYFNYISLKISAEEDAKEIREKFSWKNIGLQGYNVLLKSTELTKEIKSDMIKPEININFIAGPFIELKNIGDKKFEVEFIDSKDNHIYYSLEMGNNNWARCSIEYYKDWIIRLRDKETLHVSEYKIDLKDKNVLISLESSSLGDSISWFPHVEEFRKKHDCKVFISTFNNDLFKDNYPGMTFINPGEKVNNIYALYRIGWFYDGDSFNKNRHPRDFKNLPMQTTTTDILGLVHKPLKPKLVIKNSDSPIDSNYVCIGIHSTAQAKYWNNPNGWQELVNWFNENGYKVVSLSLEGNGYMGNHYPEGIIEPVGERTLENTIRYLKHSKMFIGLGSGLSWLSWAVGKPTVIISGFSNPTTEVLDDNIIRIFNPNVCNGCFNRHRLNPSDWNWCPDHKGTNRQFECTKNITGDHVIERIKDYIKGYTEKTADDIIQGSHNLDMTQNRKEIHIIKRTKDE